MRGRVPMSYFTNILLKETSRHTCKSPSKYITSTLLEGHSLVSRNAQLHSSWVPSQGVLLFSLGFGILVNRYDSDFQKDACHPEQLFYLSGIPQAMTK